MLSPDFRITYLRCEYLVDPEGIDELAPRLSWRLESDRRGARQVAYRIRVAQSAEELAAGRCSWWDSGRVESAQTAHVVYGGAPLYSRAACHWQVEVWDEAGAVTRSEGARWTMGLLEPAEWSARWIAADPQIYTDDPDATEPTLTEPGTTALFRREFAVPGRVRRAILYASARGLFELHLAGKRVGQDLFAPEWTDYDRRIHYRTYDVTAQLAEGRNVLAAVLGDGWWSGYVGWQETRGRYGSLENSLLVQLEIECADGTRHVITSDETWQCATGPVRASDFMMGEIYDARCERVEWLEPVGGEGRAEGWRFAREVEPPRAPLVAQRSEPVRVTQTLAPVEVMSRPSGVQIVDFGQNVAGWVRLRVEAPAGTRIVLRHGERLSPDGSLYTENLRRAKATDVYVCRGGGVETWEPRFTFHGFQYLEISGGVRPFTSDDLRACVIHSDTTLTGHFECSHAGVNRLWLNGVWSQRDNFLSVPTDCPQRDERLGWTGDAQVFLRTATYNADVAAFFTKWMIDVSDAQTPEGVFPDTAPRLREDINFVGLGGLAGAAGWADAGIIVPWTLWRVYGDRRIVERHWDAMVAWLDHIERTNPSGLRVNQLGNNYGDWLCIPADTSFGTHSPMKNLLATAFWADDATKLARMARVLNREDAARRFDAMAARVRTAFQKEFVRDDGSLTVQTQTAYVLALAFSLLPESLRESAVEHLVANIRDSGWHLSTGFIGISHLNPTLTLHGRADVAYRLLLQEEYPSWLYPVRHGATTIWERWNGWTEQDGFFNPHMNSFNHYSLGSIGEWLFRHVAGIELHPDVPGFERFVLRPYVGQGLTHASARHGTMYGEIVSAWKLQGDVLEWTVTIPPNTQARVYVPSEAGALVQESGRNIDSAEGLHVLSRDNDWLICDAVAGRYVFTSRLPTAQDWETAK